MAKKQEQIDQLKGQIAASQKSFDREHDNVIELMQQERVTDDDQAEIEGSLDELKELYEGRCELADKLQNLLGADQLDDQVQTDNQRRTDERVKLLKIKKFVEKFTTAVEVKPDKTVPMPKTAQLPKLKCPSSTEAIRSGRLSGKPSTLMS